MSNSNKQDKKDASAKPGKLQLSKTLEASRAKQGFGARSGKGVTVEVRRTRALNLRGGGSGGGAVVEVKRRAGGAESNIPSDEAVGSLSDEELQTRLQVLKKAEEESKRRVVEEAQRKEDEARRKAEEAERKKLEEEETRRREEEDAKKRAAKEKEEAAKPKAKPAIADIPPEPPIEGGKPSRVVAPKVSKHVDEEEKEEKKPQKIKLRREEPRRGGRLTITQALNHGEERMRSLASVKRQREKAKRGGDGGGQQEKVLREIVLPETISVQELGNRMAERSVDVIKELMKLGTMATASQIIDADTAELVAQEFGHKVKRVSEGDVENVLRSDEVDVDENLQPRPPVVTVMGHVDHGKTSLLDALRKTDVAEGEAGGITQHIGAYQVSLSTGQKISFLDTPGHEAFTAMRLRGAKVTDIVVLVVAADDGVREQTVEAINHARAGAVPMIIAINKIDKEGADPTRVKTELMSHEIITEDMGGDVMAVEVSAKQGDGLQQLEEAILLQAEMMELKANPNRAANGAVIEAQIDKGRGAVATFLVQRGTMRVGDIVVAGAATGRVRAILNDKGQNIEEAGPSLPVEVLGLNQPPEAGDEFAVVENDKIARDITEYRAKKSREKRSAAMAPTLDQLFTQASAARAKELPVLIKGDVQGSVEAIIGSITKYSNEEVMVKVLHSGVGAISESDISLAQASNALIIAFNVRANNQARELARQEGVEVRYYSVIYDVVDDVKAALSGMLSPHQRETMIGYARIDEVFNITKVGKVAGCVVTEGSIRRGCKVRLLRDNVVIHDGALKTLKRFKDEVKEVKSGQDCGMAFENYDDIRPGDMIEAYEVEEIARTVE